MAGERWALKKITVVIGVVLLSIFACYALPDYLPFHFSMVDNPKPSDLPPGAIASNGNYVVYSGYDASITPEEAAYVDFNGTDGQVSFFDCPLQMQFAYLPIALCGAIATFGAAFSVVRRLRRGDSNKKRAVMEFIKENPGCTAPEVARDNNMNIGTVRYYLQRLKDEGRIAFERMGKYIRVFVNSGTYSDMEKRVAIHMRSRPTMAILMAIMESPGISHQKLSEALGMEKSLLYRYTQKLLEDGIITFEWDGTSKRYFIDASVKDTLASLSSQSLRRQP